MLAVSSDRLGTAWCCCAHTSDWTPRHFDYNKVHYAFAFIDARVRTSRSSWTDVLSLKRVVLHASLSELTREIHARVHTPSLDTMQDKAPELHPVRAPPGCQVNDLGAQSPSGSSNLCTKTRAEESNTTIDAGDSSGTASSS